MNRNVKEAKLALTKKPLFATSSERFLILDELKSSYREFPQPLRFSKIFSELLSRVSLPLEEFDLVAGRCVDRELSEEEEVVFQAFIKHPDHPSRSLIYSLGHCTFSWEELSTLGLDGLRAMARERLATEEHEDKKLFLTAMIEVYDAISAYALRYATAAREKGMEELAINLEKAASCPDSFTSCLQFFWLITLIECAYMTENPTLTVGRLDRVLFPFYCKDVESGALTKERAKEYITDYYCKHNLIMGRGEHQVGDETNSTTFRRILNFDAPQYLLLAGTDEEGKLVANELTELFAECIEPSFKNPVVVVRYVEGMDRQRPALWKTLCEKALQSSSLMFYHDRAVLEAFQRLGLPKEDAQKYAHFGCNWCSPGDNSAWMFGSVSSAKFQAYTSEEERKQLNVPYFRTNSEHSWPEDFMIVLRTLAKRENVSIDDFYELFFERMAEFIDRKLAHQSHELAVRKRKPSAVLTFDDCFLVDSIRTAECFSAGAKYHFELQAFQMFGTVADCFIVTDQLVLREKKLTLARLLEATEANFEGYPDVLALCRNAEKYGMDTPLSNAHVERLARMASTLTIEKSRPYFEKEKLFLVPCIQSDTWHLKYGEKYGATPNGRLANTPFSQNMRPSNGACTGGLTAMFNSMLQIPSGGFVSGSLNLDVDANEFQGESGKAVFAALLASYFNRGGLHAQVSATSACDLLDAKLHPEEHRDLRVRVTGYSGVFVDICERLQNDIIERFQ